MAEDTRVAAHRFSNELRYRDSLHPNQRRLTPSYVLEPVRETLGGIELDPCTEPNNPTGANRFYAPPDDGLSEPWDAGSVFVNPPYSRAREPWILRCIDVARSGSRVALLVPAYTDTRFFHTSVDTATAVVFIRGRITFGVLRPNRRQEASSHGSMVMLWNVDPTKSLARLGTVMRPESGGW